MTQPNRKITLDSINKELEAIRPSNPDTSTRKAEQASFAKKTVEPIGIYPEEDSPESDDQNLA